MKRVLFILFLTTLLVPGTSFGQEVHYYTLSAIVKDGKRTAPKKSSGLFVAFSKKICYDSDSEGFDLKKSSGKLSYSAENEKVIQYKGKCYFGDAEYNFSKDKSHLNIKTSDGYTYIYQGAEPPASVKQSFYGDIADRRVTNNPSPLPASGGYYPGASYGGNSGGSYSGGSGNNASTHRETCPGCGGDGKCRGYNTGYIGMKYFCGGTGKCYNCNGTGHYRNPYTGKEDTCGMCSYGRCAKCGGTGTCPLCHGTGYK